MTINKFLLLIFTTIFLSPTFAVENYSTAKFKPLYRAQCISTARLVEQFTQVPPNQTYIHVRHMGDVGTPEWLNQTGTNISWDVSTKTGYSAPILPSVGRTPYQAGYIDDPISPKNAYQVYCTNFGFFINTFQFGHENPIQCPVGFPNCAGGPHITYSREFSPPLEVWRNESSELTLQTRMKLPKVHYSNPNAAGQISFYYTAQNKFTGDMFFGLIGVFRSKANPKERSANDGVLNYVSTPLLSTNSLGEPMRYATKSPYSYSLKEKYSWSGSRFLRAHVSWENFENIIEDLNLGGNYSPSDYRILQAGILIETLPLRNDGSGTADISLGGSFDKFEVFEAYDY